VPRPAFALAPVELLINPGFELGVPPAPWTQSTLRGKTLVTNDAPQGGPHSGLWEGRLGATNNEHDLLSQTVIIPAGAASASLRFWYSIKSTGNGSDPAPLDSLSVQIRDVDGVLLGTIATFTSAGKTKGWIQSPAYPVNQFIGQLVVLTFEATTNGTKPTFFFLDDVSLSFVPNASPAQVDLAYINPRKICRIRPQPDSVFLSGVVPIEVVGGSSTGLASLMVTLDGSSIATTSSTHLLFNLDSRTLSSGAHTLEAVATATTGEIYRCPLPIVPSPFLQNGDFEDPLGTPAGGWSPMSDLGSGDSLLAGLPDVPPISGNLCARFGGRAFADQSLTQYVQFPAEGGVATLSFYARVHATKTSGLDEDHLTVSLEDPFRFGQPAVLQVLSNLSAIDLDLSQPGGYTLYLTTIDLAATGLAGAIRRVSLHGLTVGGEVTTFLVDAVGLTVPVPAAPNPPPPSIAILTPSNGANVTGPKIVVTGTATSSSGTIGIAVNGRSALIDRAHAGTPLDPFVWRAELTPASGTATMPILATASDGTRSGSATESVGVTAGPTPVFEVKLTPSRGLVGAPVKTSYEWRGTTEPMGIGLPLDGSCDYGFLWSLPYFNSDLEITFETEGLHTVCAVMVDELGDEYSTTATVAVESFTTVNNAIHAEWNSFVADAAAQNLDALATHLASPELGARYRAKIEAILPGLPSYAASLGAMEMIDVTDDMAEYLVVQDEGGAPRSHFIYFVRGASGLWKIRQF